jgi:SAM-dependent methyltransferase
MAPSTSERSPEPRGVDVPLGRETMSSGLEHAQNFHAWTHDWIGPHVRGRILDVGGGTANHLRFFERETVVSIDLSPEAVAELRERFRARPNWSFEAGDITSPETVARLGTESFDTVLSCNVFEHIPRDDLAFERAAQLLRPGGRLVLVLPAHQALFGSMDRLAGHFRRYERGRARAELVRVGLRPVDVRYVNLVGAVGWFVNNRLVSHDDLSSPAVNAQIGLFDRVLVPVLRRLEGRALHAVRAVAARGRREGGPMSELRGDTIRDFGEQWTAFRDNDGYYASQELFRDIAGPFADAVGLEGAKACDIGSGTGRIVRMLAAAGAAHVLAVEPSAAYDVLVDNVRDLGERVTAVRAAGEDFPATGDRDVVVSFGVLHHIPEPARVPRRASRRDAGR